MLKICYLYWIIPIIAVFNIIFRSLFYTTTSYDSSMYFNAAKDLPIIKDSIFPLLYPLLLRSIHTFFSDYFISSKVLSILSLLFILYFSKQNNFFWKEIWIISISPIFLYIMPMSWSEILLPPILIVFCYVNYQFFHNKMSNKKFIISNSILLFLLILTKYSCIFILIGDSLVLLYLFLTKEKKQTLALFISLLASSSLILIYLGINYILTGYLTGQRVTPALENMNFPLIYYNLLRSFNPFFDKHILTIKIHYILITIIALLILLGYTYLLTKSKNFQKKEILQSIVITIISMFFITISYIKFNIDPLSDRLLFYCSIFLYMAIIYSINNITYYVKHKDYILGIMSILFLFFGYSNLL